MNATLKKIWRIGRTLFLIAIVLGTGGSAAWFANQMPGNSAAGQTSVPAVAATAKIQRESKHGLIVPAEIAKNMRMEFGKAQKPTQALKLPPFQGVLALDNNSLARVHARFAGEVVTIGTSPETPEAPISTNGPADGPRALRLGDPVKKGQLLAIVWSKDLGEKKSELVDAISKLKTDEQTLSRLKELYEMGGTAERSLRESERNVQSDRAAVERADQTLRVWRLNDAEIKAIYTEADKLTTADSKRIDPKTWAKVEVRSPQDGVVLEKNVAPGDIIDTTNDLFKVGDMSHLAVWAHVYEEDLMQLSALPKPILWTVQLPAKPTAKFGGTLEQIGAVIDPNQHTALVTGRIENANGELRIGQFVTVSIDLPPANNEVEVPADSIVEDGRESAVFVRVDPKESKFLRKPVKVTRRFRDLIYIAVEKDGVQPGQVLVTKGSLLLMNALEDLPVPSAK